jgi:hypothetical protein
MARIGGLFHKEVELGNIEGYDDINDIVRRALDAKDNYNLLFIRIVLRYKFEYQYMMEAEQNL